MGVIHRYMERRGARLEALARLGYEIYYSEWIGKNGGMRMGKFGKNGGGHQGGRVGTGAVSLIPILTPIIYYERKLYL